MPYIKPERREHLKRVVEVIDGAEIGDAGELNYLVTCLVRRFLKARTFNYENLNSAVGVLEAAKLELYRRLAGPYEDRKIQENGDVY
jgi:hypothetical protein